MISNLLYTEPFVSLNGIFKFFCFNRAQTAIKLSEIFYSYICRQLKKLDEDSLTKQPEEVFDVLEKLGEGYVLCDNAP